MRNGASFEAYFHRLPVGDGRAGGLFASTGSCGMGCGGKLDGIRMPPPLSSIAKASKHLKTTAGPRILQRALRHTRDAYSSAPANHYVAIDMDALDLL